MYLGAEVTVIRRGGGSKLIGEKGLLLGNIKTPENLYIKRSVGYLIRTTEAEILPYGDVLLDHIRLAEFESLSADCGCR